MFEHFSCILSMFFVPMLDNKVTSNFVFLHGKYNQTDGEKISLSLHTLLLCVCVS